jgi:hypothetical protein
MKLTPVAITLMNFKAQYAMQNISDSIEINSSSVKEFCKNAFS